MAKLYVKADTSRTSSAGKKNDSAEKYRSDWRRDYARLIHCAAFRRLQGKTQLFPNHESDFFRNRLTHSFEVAQIAKSIATRLNSECAELSTPSLKIDTDLVEFAGLAHDLGHPPFGHNGEKALNQCMRNAGGFEGNAQTLRILARLEKRQNFRPDGAISPVVSKKGADNRTGLNLCYRSLASILKYDSRIPKTRKSENPEVSKGYYYSEEELVRNIKRSVLRENNLDKAVEFKTIECSIMDVADDIAYSTYDLEDAFKGGFLNPIQMVASPDEVYKEISKEVTSRINKFYPDLSNNEKKFTTDDARSTIITIFEEIFDSKIEKISSLPEKSYYAAKVYEASNELSRSGYLRTQFTSAMVGRFIRGVELSYDKKYPQISKVRLNIDIFKEVETFKTFAYNSLIDSSILKVSEHRGKDIVKQIFGVLSDKNGYKLMPDDFRWLYENLAGENQKLRVVSDFIAGMTDNYALTFYNRLFGTQPETVFKPL